MNSPRSFLPIFFSVMVLFGAGCVKKESITIDTDAEPSVQVPVSLPSVLQETAPPQPSPQTNPPPPMITQSPPQPTPFVFRSSAFASGAVIPQKYSCDGADISPLLAWSGAPEGTKSFALIINDPDAVQVVGKVVDHWVLWNIPATTTSIAEGTVPAGASQGMGYDAPKYQGPCPPSGTTHRYVFVLYALDIERLDLPSSTSGASLQAAMQGHILKKAEFTGHFTAKSE